MQLEEWDPVDWSVFVCEDAGRRARKGSVCTRSVCRERNESYKGLPVIFFGAIKEAKASGLLVLEETSNVAELDVTLRFLTSEPWFGSSGSSNYGLENIIVKRIPILG